jgi:two-component system cell cycle response regulator
VDTGQPRIILVDVSDASREVMVERLSAQGYSVESVGDPLTGADMALSAPPAAVIADLWMPSTSGVQLCRLLRAEPATADVPVILRGENDDPRSRFWAERAGATAYVRKGRMGELVRVLSKTARRAADGDDFFVQLGGGSIDIRARIARHLDTALFDMVIAAEVRSLAACASFQRLFDLFAQFVCQVIGYRWVALGTDSPPRFAVHCHPTNHTAAEQEARAALRVTDDIIAQRVVDEDASAETTPAAAPIVARIPFGNTLLGTLALGPSSRAEADTEALVGLIARELAGPLRIAALMDEQQRLAWTDPLTGLRNRRSFLEQARVEVARASRYGSPLSFLLFDVDHFKSINDTHGHAGGDCVLAALGKLLVALLRTPDIPARWGGEEFVIALPSTGAEGARGAAERVRHAVEQLKVEWASKQIPVTVSVGGATFRPGDSLDGLTDRADRAMYAAKVAGRNRITIDADPVPVVPKDSQNLSA